MLAQGFETIRKDIFSSLGITSLDELSNIYSVDDISVVKKLIHVADSLPHNTQEEIYDIIMSSGALLNGHFELLSGKHSDYFIRFSKISRNTSNLRLISRCICNNLIDKVEFDIIVAPETAGGVLASSISRILHDEFNKTVQTVYAKTDSDKKPTSLINWIDLKENCKVLIVNDIISTGTGIQELMNIACKKGCSVTGVCVFSYRTDLSDLDFLHNNFFFSLTNSTNLKDFTYENSINCTLCKTPYNKKPVQSKFLN